MNLHIFNDEKFFDPFVNKLEELNLLDNNKFVVKRKNPLKYIKRKDLVFCRLHHIQIIGDTKNYDKVFIHAFSYDLYKWVNDNDFKQLNWMIWGSELYEMRGINFELYESETHKVYKKLKNIKYITSILFRDFQRLIFNIKINKVYKKIDNVLTWITPEYQLAINNIKGLNAKHQYFLYGFDIDIEKISNEIKITQLNQDIKQLKCIIGNSGAITNNHLDALHKIKNCGFEDILIPISYGNQEYKKLLIKEIKASFGDLNLTYLDKFMNFQEYLDVLDNYDVMITNSLRPLGMGNIWIALLSGKLVFMNNKNFMYKYMCDLGFEIFDIDKISNIKSYIQRFNGENNKFLSKQFLSENRINEIYRSIF